MANDCKEWPGGRNMAGYGLININGRMNRKAHRFIYELLVGPIPAGMVVMHTCDNPPCVNPLHLRVGTIADNNLDKELKGRSVTNGNAKLTESDAAEIRQGLTCAQAKARFGIGTSQYYNIRNGTCWKKRPRDAGVTL